MLGGLVLACAWFVPFPDFVFLLAVAAFLGGIVALSVLAYRDSRANGVGFWRALGRSLRDGGRAFLHLFP